MDTVGDLVARERRSDALALRTDSRAGSYSYEKLCTTAWKAGNLFRHYGVREGATVAVDAAEALSPPPLTAFLGAGLLGATVTFDPGRRVEARALVVPADRVADYDSGPGTQVLAYGDDPDETGVAHFEREVWSENPTMPPEAVAPGTAFLAADGETYTHRRLLTAADRVAREAGLTAADSVAVRAPLSDAGTVVGGVLAPLSVGGTILIDRDRTGEVGVGRGVPEARTIDPAEVPL